MNRAAVFAAVLASILLAIFVSSASADVQICPPGPAAGQCEQPQGLATDFETGNLYVADKANNRIDVFESDGSFVMAFGWGVDSGSKKLETCTAATTCQAGTAGTGAGQLSAPNSVAVDNDPTSASQHDVYVFDANQRIEKFDPEGKFLLRLGSEGLGKCQFSTGGSGAVQNSVGVGPGGVVYATNSPNVGPGLLFVDRIE